MNDQKKIDDIVSMIDRFMAGEGGHMNLSVHQGDAFGEIKSAPGLECEDGHMACQAPTLHQGLDACANEECQL